MTDFIFAAYTPSTELCSLRGPGTRRDRKEYLVQSFALTFISRPRPTGSGTGSPVHNVASSAGYVLATHNYYRAAA